MKRLIILGSVLLLVSMGIFSSGCLDDGEDEAAADCAENFCIGTLLPEGEVFNRPLIEAVNLAKGDINKAGGNIEIISGNSFNAAAGEATASAARLLETGVRGIVGPSYSSDSQEVHPFLVESKIVGISPSATSPVLTSLNEEIVDSGNQIFFFRTPPSDSFNAPILAKQTQGNTVIVNRDDTWGGPLAELVKEKIESSGRQVRVVSYDHDPIPPAADVVSRVEAAVEEIPNVESIVLLVFEEGGEIIRGLLDSLDIPADGYYTGDGLPVQVLFDHVEEENGEIEGFKRVTSTPVPGEKLEEFEERFDAEIDDFHFTARAYDAVVILSLAALSAGSNDPSVYVSKIQEVTKGGTQCHSYATCAAALTDETATNDDIDYEGVSGPIELDDNGDITAGFYIVVETYDARGGKEEIFFDSQGEEVNPTGQ